MTLATKTRTSQTVRIRVFVWLLVCAVIVAMVGLLNADELEASAENQSAKVESKKEQDPAIDDPYRINAKPKVSEGIGVDDRIGDAVVQLFELPQAVQRSTSEHDQLLARS